MTKEPIDYDGFLGISKKEWTRVLGVNLALVLTVYVIAMICTLCRNDFFVLKFHSESLQRIEDVLRGWGIYALVQFLFATLEASIITLFTVQRKYAFWIPLSLYAAFVASNLICWAAMGAYPGYVQMAITALFLAIVTFAYHHSDKKDALYALLRLGIGVAVSLGLNELIALLRINTYALWHNKISNSFLFALNFEYQIALVLSFLFLSIALPLVQKKGEPQCLTDMDAGGSSPNTMNSLPRKSPKAKANNELSPKTKKRLRILKAKVIAIQTVALVMIAFLPWAVGRPVEFSLVYASFCLTRYTLGFSHSLHFKSELVCVTVGAVVFWLLTLLTPSVEVCLIMSLAYGAAMAIGFRLYWELHDLILYKKAAKLDRYAMLFAAFKGDLSPKHVFGIMRIRGYGSDDIELVQAYLSKEKVEAIAFDRNYSKRAIESKLTELATELYERR